MATPSTQTKYTTLYAFQAQAGSAGLPGFKTTTVIGASDDQLKDLIRSRMQSPGSEVLIIPSNKWGAPAITAADAPSIQRVFPEALTKAVKYLTQCGFQVNPNELMAGGTVLPNPASGKIFFVFRVEGAPAQPMTMHPSLQNQTAGTQADRGKKWWEFWKK